MAGNTVVILYRSTEEIVQYCIVGDEQPVVYCRFDVQYYVSVDSK